MNRNLIKGIAVAAVLSSSVIGYRVGASRKTAIAQPVMVDVANAEQPTPRAVLYWKDPDGKNDFSPTPKRTADGRDYIAVYDEQESPIAGSPAAKPKGQGKPLYYRNPMGLADTSPVPKKDSMGMDYIPVFEDDGDASTVKVSLDRVQRSGVRSEAAQLRRLERPVRAAGVAKPDERTLRSVTLRADGFIEKLYVNETGKHITAGEPMFTVYSPQVVSAQVDFRTNAAAGARGPRDEQSAIRRLKNLDVPDAVIDQLRNGAAPAMSFDWPAPMSGVVMEKKIVVGQMAKAGDELFRLADLSNIWVIANVAEQDIGVVKLGAPAKLIFRAYPGEVFEGQVAFILHELDMATRTAKVRIEVKNPDHRIKHEMFADVEINAGAGDAQRLVVPTSAVIDSGNRQVVIIDKGQGRFEPRAVKLGARGDGFTEILDGLKEGESVVTSANFLIDAESNLRAALKAFTAEPKPIDKMEGKP